MSYESPTTSGVPPRWMPIGTEPELCQAGKWWDVVRTTEAVGRRVVELLVAGNEPVGPVILDHGGPEPRVYFLVPVGTAEHWTEPETVGLGLTCHVVVPPHGSTSPPGTHWHVLPRAPRLLTGSYALRRAVRQARRERANPVERG